MSYLCNLILPGAAKSGTSSLHNLLAQHPEVCMSKPKEPQFFSFEEHYAEGVARHNRLFDHCSGAKIFGESSQCYFAHAHAVDRIAASLPEPKIIILLRDPIKRLLSQYAWNRRRATETDTLTEAILSRGESVDYLFDERIGMFREEGGYVAFSRYSRWVPMWQKRFGVGKVLVLRFENFVVDQAAIAQRCFDFLGVEKMSGLDVAESNMTEKTTVVILPRGIKHLARLMPKHWKEAEIYHNVRKTMHGWLTPVPDLSMSPDFREYLEGELAADIAFHRNLEGV